MEISASTFDAEEAGQVRARYDKELKAILGKLGVQVDGIDIWVGLYRPDKPFATREGKRPLADLIIRNEQATNK